MLVYYAIGFIGISIGRQIAMKAWDRNKVRAFDEDVAARYVVGILFVLVCITNILLGIAQLWRGAADSNTVPRLATFTVYALFGAPAFLVNQTWVRPYYAALVALCVLTNLFFFFV